MCIKNELVALEDNSVILIAKLLNCIEAADIESFRLDGCQLS